MIPMLPRVGAARRDASLTATGCLVPEHPLVGGIDRKHNTWLVNTVAQAPRFSGDLADRLAAQGPLWILLLLIVLVGLRGALLVADLAGPRTATVGTASLGAPAASRKVVDVPAILRANLFGQGATASGVDAPVTTMNLKLAFVIAATDPKNGMAALGSSDSDVNVYKVGDEVPGGARLNAVYVDRVLLDRGGSIEALLLPMQPGGSAVAPPPMPMGINPSASAQRVQQAIQNNPGLLNQVIQRQAVFADGRLRGMRVNPGSNAQAFARLGLKPNDLVTAINGTPLDDQARSNEIFGTLSSSAEAHVTVVRNGREMELNLNLADIANEAERLSEAPQTPPLAPQNAPPPPEPEPGTDATR